MLTFLLHAASFLVIMSLDQSKTTPDV